MAAGVNGSLARFQADYPGMVTVFVYADGPTVSTADRRFVSAPISRPALTGVVCTSAVTRLPVQQHLLNLTVS